MTFKTSLKAAVFGGAALFGSTMAMAQVEPTPTGGASDPFGGTGRGAAFDGAVYVMSNKLDDNTVVAYGRASDGTLTFNGEFSTGGQGSTEFDGPEGLDPLISGDSVVLSDDRRFLFAVNAGSNSVSAFVIRDNLSLRLVDVEPVDAVGPITIAYRDGVIVVGSVDADGVFTGEADQEGAIQSFTVSRSGNIRPIARSRRVLKSRPADVRFSPDGRFLTVTSLNGLSIELPDADELYVFGVNRDGVPSANALDSVSSTPLFSPDGRRAGSPISQEIVEDEGRQFVVVTETREFSDTGLPPVFPALQGGSVSTWELEADGQLTPITLDVRTTDAEDFLEGERTACWLEFSADGNEFWVSNTIDSNISAFTFDKGVIEFVGLVAGLPSGAVNRTSGVQAFGTVDPEVDGESEGWIDMAASDNGEYLYQLLGLRGAVRAYKTEDDGSLTFVQEASGNLPRRDTQGIAAF